MVRYWCASPPGAYATEGDASGPPWTVCTTRARFAIPSVNKLAKNAGFLPGAEADAVLRAGQRVLRSRDLRRVVEGLRRLQRFLRLHSGPSRTIHVDVAQQLRGVGQDGHLVIGDLKEAAADGVFHCLAARLAEAQLAGGQLA